MEDAYILKAAGRPGVIFSKEARRLIAQMIVLIRCLETRPDSARRKHSIATTFRGRPVRRFAREMWWEHD